MFFDKPRPPAWREDLPAALTVSALLLPQSLAYAMLSGLPPVVGVMASLLPLIAYALLGSSPTLGLGPVALLALVMAESIGQLAPEHGVAPTLVGMVLAIEVGVLMGLAVLLRLHALSALLSAPVLAAFSSGSALAIGLGQLPTLLGTKLPGGTLIDWLPALWAGAPPAPHQAALAFGVGALVLLLAVKRFGRHAPRLVRLAPLGLVVAVAVLASSLAGQPALQGMPQVGAVSLAQGLRFPGLDQAPAALWAAALPTAGLLALVAYVSSLAGAQALARKRGETLSPPRELLGLAAANVVAGASGGMPVAGSFSRSSVMHEAGARTRWTGVFTAIAFALWITVGAGLLAALPQAVLAATILVAVLPMVEWQPFVRAWRYARPEAVLMGVVALLVVVAGAGWALSIGVLGAIALLLQRTARPHWAEVGRLPGPEPVFRNVKRFEVELSPRLLTIRIDEGLCFTNARWLSDMLWAELDRHASADHLVLMMSGVNDIDLSGLEALMQIATELQAKGKQLHFSELKGPVADRLNAAGLDTWLPGRVFRTQAEAWAALA